MERRYLKDLVEWNDRKDRKPLIVWGARQIGKTYLVRDIFAERYYKGSYVYIDCREDPGFCRYCETHPKASDVLEYISLDREVTIGPSTLIIIDEAQECLPVITLMKYMCQDHREIPVIVTGSMVRIRIKRKKRGPGQKEFLFPVGKISEITLTQMSFDEYLYNRNRKLYDMIVEQYSRKVPMLKEFHQMAMGVFYEYLLVGGMPEQVDTYLKTHSFNEQRRILKELYNNYLSDMDLYQASPDAVVRSRAIFSSVYTLLNRELKNFSPSAVEKGTRNRDMRSAIDWLTEAGVVMVSRKLEGHVTIPFIGSEGAFRIYLQDMGMFTVQSSIPPASLLTDEGRNTLSGVFYENFAAEELRSRGIGLFYWCGKRGSEFEFVLQKNGSVIPVDVKKKRGKLTSLKGFTDVNPLDHAVKISANNYGFDPDMKILTLPFYELFLFADEIADPEIPEDVAL